MLLPRRSPRLRRQWARLLVRGLHGPRLRRVAEHRRAHRRLVAQAAALGDCWPACSWGDWFALLDRCRRDPGFAGPSVFDMTAVDGQHVLVPQDGQSLAAILDCRYRGACLSAHRIRCERLYRALAQALGSLDVSHAGPPVVQIFPSEALLVSCGGTGAAGRRNEPLVRRPAGNG